MVSIESGVAGSSSVYSASSASSSAASGAQSTAEAAALPGDSASINTFTADLKSDFDFEGDLNALYSQKAKVEGDVGTIKNQMNDAQAQISARKQVIAEEKAPDEEGDQKFADVKQLYDQTVEARKTAQTELSNIKNESAGNDRAINTNAQMQQSVSSQISTAQSQLSSLRAASKSGGGKGEGEEGSEAQGCDNSGQIAELEQKISDLQAQLENLKSVAQELQAKKANLDRQKATKEAEMSKLDATIQVCKQGMDEYHNEKAENNPAVKDAFDRDSQLQELQKNYDELQAQLTDKEAELNGIESQIAAAESRNEPLQAAREERRDQEFQDAANAAGFNTADAEARVKNDLAKEEYNKSYDELTLEEQMAIEARADGMVTLEALEHARKLLEQDPDNAAAQAVIEKGAKNLDAQAEAALSKLSSSFDSILEDMKGGALEAMNKARAEAGEGTDPETAAMEALANYITEQANNSELSAEEAAALKSLLGAAGDYLDALDTTDKGTEILQQAAESYNKSELAAMKAQLADELGVDVDQLIVLSGTGDKDDISIRNDYEGGLYIIINGEEKHYTAEEAKYLIIDGGDGDDDIYTEWGSGVETDLHIFGGKGDDYIRGGEGNDMLFGGAGDDRIYAEGGSDIVLGGEGDDELCGGDGNDYIYGGAGNDLIGGGAGDDIISGDEGDDELYGEDGNDIISGGADNDEIHGGDGDDNISGDDGKDEIYGDKGDDYIDGGEDDDEIHGGKGNDFILGSGGNDTINGDQDEDIIYGGLGDDDINGGGGNDLIFGEQGSDTIHGGGGDDVISGGGGNDHLYGDNGDDKIYGNGGDDYIDGGWGYDQSYGGEGKDDITGDTIFTTDLKDQDGEGDFAEFAQYLEIDGEEVDMSTLMRLAAEEASALETVSGGVNTAGKVLEKGAEAADKIGDPTKLGAMNAEEKLNIYQKAIEKMGLPPEKVATLSKWFNRAGVAGGILRSVAGVGEIVDGIQDHDVSKVAGGAGDLANGVSTATGAFKNLYHGSKISAKGLEKLGTFSKAAGVVGNAISVFSGVLEAIEGVQNGDGWQTASGVFEAISGVAGALAMIPCCTVVCAPIALVCSLIHWGIDLFNG